MTTNPYIQDELVDRAIVRKSEYCETLEIAASKITFQLTSQDTKDQIGIYQIQLQPHSVGAQLHYHRFMDETFLVNEGKLTIMHGDQTTTASPGDMIYVPRFTPHGFRNDGDQPVRVTLVFNPALQREGFFRGLQHALSTDPPDIEALFAIYTKYDSYPIDPNNMTPLVSNSEKGTD